MSAPTQDDYLLTVTSFPSRTETIWQYFGSGLTRYRILVAYRNKDEGTVGVGITHGQAALLFAALAHSG